MYLFLDCEMGGTDLDKSLLQVGLIITDNKFKEIARGLFNVKPDDGVYHVTAQALDVNKINLIEHDKIADKYKDAKPKLYEAIYMFSSYGKDKLTVVGKQVSGDVRFIWEYLISRPTWEQFCSYRIFDITAVWMFLKLTGKVPNEIGDGLTDICNYFNIDTEGQHNAIRDCELTLECMKRCVQL